jgi:hypothetical protein
LADHAPGRCFNTLASTGPASKFRRAVVDATILDNVLGLTARAGWHFPFPLAQIPPRSISLLLYDYPSFFLLTTVSKKIL